MKQNVCVTFSATSFGYIKVLLGAAGFKNFSTLSPKKSTLSFIGCVDKCFKTRKCACNVIGAKCLKKFIKLFKRSGKICTSLEISKQVIKNKILLHRGKRNA